MSVRKRGTAWFAAALEICLAAALGSSTASAAEQTFRAGAAEVDVSPRSLPVIVNGGMLEQQTDVVRDPPYARAVVVDDGATRLAIVVVDSCMMPRELIDRAKRIAHEQTGIPEDRMLVSATHTHSAPSCMGALGTRPDHAYAARLPAWIAEAIAQANANLAPALVGWTGFDDNEHTHCRRWIRRPDRMLTDPFGDRTVRANMHPGYQSPDVIGPSGPVDPAISVVSFRTPAGRPIALLANYSMHYFGTAPVSADYFGRFAARVKQQLAQDAGDRPLVATMSQGTSGDQHWMDYARPKPSITIDAYADAIAQEVVKAARAIEYRSWAPLAMAETRLTLRRRTPTEKRLAWARPIVDAMRDRVPRTQPEVYAQEALYLHEEPERELKLQAIRVGELGIAAIPNEVFALSGLKIKSQSPLAMTFVIELANGSEGYIPPPEQHELGGYTTWPARTAALEVEAEPKIVAAVLSLLERVAERPRRTPSEPNGAYAHSVLASRPLAYWRLAEMSGRTAADASGKGPSASFQGGVALFLEGPAAPAFSGAAINRAVHLAGGRLVSGALALGPAYTAEFWFWNGLPNDARSVTAILFSERPAQDRGTQLALAGPTGRLVLSGNGADDRASGTAEIAPKSWHHLVLVRQDESITVYLDGLRDVSARARAIGKPLVTLSFGGASQSVESLEGRIDEVAVYDRALGPEEIEAHRRSLGGRGRASGGR